MSATIGIQTITPTTGTAQGQAQQLANDNANKAAAKAVAGNIFADAVKQLQQSEPGQTLAASTKHHVDKTV